MAVNTTGDMNLGTNDATSGLNFDSMKPNNRGGRAATDISLISRFRDRQKFLSLSDEGNKYIETLKKLNSDSNTRFQFESFKTNSNIDTVCITHEDGRHAVVLGFTEVAPKSGENPIITYLQPAIDQFINKGVSVANAILVGPEDYGKSANMFQYICDVIDVATNNPSIQMDASSFSNVDILVSTNLSEAEDTLRKMYPHTVLPRMDVAATFKIQDPRNREDQAAIAVVTGYTDFIGNSIQQGYGPATIKFSPIFHMEIHSPIADPCLMGLVLPSAIDIFCVNHQWLRVYDNYGPNDLNLGLLIPASNTLAPWRAKDRNERDDFIRKYVDPVPNPVLDITAGKAQIPLVKYLVNDQNQINIFKQKLANFFGGIDPNIIPNPIDLGPQDIINYTGIVQDITEGKDALVDSRKIDYLHIANKSNSVERAQLWLNYWPDPSVRSKALHEFYPSKWENRFSTTLRVINADFLNMMNYLLKERRITFIYENRYDSTFGGGLFDPAMNLLNAQNLRVGGLQRTNTLARGTTFHL